MKSLILDRRTFLGDKPQVHAVLLGVSEYPHLPAQGTPETQYSFGMQKLSSPALSCYRISEWLMDQFTRFSPLIADDAPPADWSAIDALPISTIRMLLLPSEAEIQTQPKLTHFQQQWGLDEVNEALSEWREDARKNKGNVTFFWFSGHGVQRSHDAAVMLLPEFGRGNTGTLAKCFDLANVFYGMAPGSTQPEIARRQFYFVDCCRVTPEAFKQFEHMNTPDVFDVELSGVDDRNAPIFFSAMPGDFAYGRAGKTSIFTEAVLQSFTGIAGEPSAEDQHSNILWRVSVQSLDRALTSIFNTVSRQYGVDQRYVTGGALRQTPICLLSKAPEVEFFLEVVPPEAAKVGSLVLMDRLGAAAAPICPVDPNPWRNKLPAGNYTIRISFPAGANAYGEFLRPCMLWPATTRFRARIQQQGGR